MANAVVVQNCAAKTFRSSWVALAAGIHSMTEVGNDVARWAVSATEAGSP